MKRQTNTFLLLREEFKKSKKLKIKEEAEDYESRKEFEDTIENGAQQNKSQNNTNSHGKSSSNSNYAKKYSQVTRKFLPEKEIKKILKNEDKAVCRDKLSVIKSKTDLKKMIILMDRESNLVTFRGLVELTILRGSVEVMGFSKFIENKPYQLFSPGTESLLTISLYNNDSVSTVDELELNESEWDNDVQSTIKDWIKHDSNCAILLITELSSVCGIREIESMMPVFKSIFHDQKTESLIPGFSIVNHEIKHSQSPNDWQYPEMKISSVYITKLLGLGSGSVHCIVGGKNSGKSCLARHLTNFILSRRKQVAFLDCDVGQPELTPIGLLSLSILSDPLLGPPFTHLKVPDYARYVGSTSAKLDPDEYIGLLIQLINIYKAKYLHLDLVVNTSGWVKGVGFDLLNHFITMLSPTNLIVLEGAKQGNLFESLQQNLLSIKDLNMVFQQSVSENLTNRMKLNAADQRNLNLISYFMQEPNGDITGNSSKSWNFNMPLSCRNPISVPLSKISLKFLNSQVPFSQAFYALNGTIVGLVNDATAYHAHSVSNEIFFKIIPTHTPLHQANCLGLGLIRSIDLVSNTLYLLTPVPLSMLTRVNLLVRGSPSLECPVSLLTQQMKGKSALKRKDAIGVPYTTSFLAEGVGANEIKTRHLGRKKLQE